MSSRRRSIINPFPEARYSSAFSVEIFVKDYYFPSNIRINSDDWFLAVGNILNKISSKDLPMVCFVVTQHSESALSLCLRYSKTSCLQATPKKHPSKIRWLYKKKRRYSHTTSSALHKNPYLIYFFSCKYTNKTDTLQIFPYIFLFSFVKIKLFLP